MKHLKFICLMFTIACGSSRDSQQNPVASRTTPPLQPRSDQTIMPMNDAADRTEQPNTEKITLRTKVKNLYISALNAGGSTLSATAATPQNWEVLDVIDSNGDNLESGDVVQLRTSGGFFLQVQNGNLAAASKNQQDATDLIVVKTTGSGPIVWGDSIGFQVAATGLWLSAQDGGGGAVTANGAALRDWEIFTFHQSPAATVALKKASMLQYLREISGQKTIVGIENKNAATPTSDSQVMTSITGRSPSLWGGDFGFGAGAVNYRKGLMEEVKSQFRQGALVTLMYHACAPTRDEYCSWDDIGGRNPQKLNETQFRELLTPGTGLYKNWINRLDTLAVFLEDLKQAGVVVIFRPFHEVNQCVFWWSCHKGTYGTAQLYRMTHDYLTKDKGLDNLIWAWNIQDFNTLSSDVNVYSPGPEYFDIATLDVYNTGYTQSNYDTMLRVAVGKPIAIGECQFMPTAELLSKQNKWVYAMLWPDFIEENRKTLPALYNSDRVLTLDEMPGW
jgi:beta-mannanase